MNNLQGGAWEYTLTGSAPWFTFGAASGTAARLLPATARVRFRPNPNFTGNPTITYRAWDQTQGTAGETWNVSTTASRGGTMSFSNAVETATAPVTPPPPPAAFFDDAFAALASDDEALASRHSARQRR